MGNNRNSDDTGENGLASAAAAVTIVAGCIAAFRYMLGQKGFEEVFWTVLGRKKTAPFRLAKELNGERVTGFMSIPNELAMDFAMLAFSWFFLVAIIAYSLIFMPQSDKILCPDWWKPVVFIAIPLLLTIIVTRYRKIWMNIESYTMVHFGKHRIEYISIVEK